MVRINNLTLNGNVNLRHVSTEEDDTHEYLYLKGKVHTNVSLDDHIISIIYNNANNHTSGYEVIYNPLQYIDIDEKISSEPLLAYQAYYRHLNADITDIRNMKHTTYHSIGRMIYLAIRRKKSDDTNKSMKETPFNGEISSTNIQVATKIQIQCSYRP